MQENSLLAKNIFPVFHNPIIYNMMKQIIIWRYWVWLVFNFRALCEGLNILALSDSIGQTEKLKSEIAQGKEMIAIAQRALGIKAKGKTKAGDGERQRRSSSAPEVIKEKEENLLRVAAKKHAGLVDSNDKIKKRLKPEEQKQYEDALAYLRKQGWTSAALIRAEEKKKAKAKKKA